MGEGAGNSGGLQGFWEVVQGENKMGHSQGRTYLIAAGEDKNCLYKYICNKRRAKEDLHPLLDVEGSTVARNG